MNEFITDIKKNAHTYSSLPFWSWNDKLEPEELRRQIRRMHELGMNGFFMHARGGLETEYLSEEWYDCIRACVREAEKLGMEAWSYDENGWPSGFAGGKLLEDPANHATWLSYETSAEYPSGENILGVYVIEGNKLRRVTEPENGIYHVIRQRYDSSYVDTMDADITRKFIAATHADYKEKIGFSPSMPGFFTDEPQYYRAHTPWSNKMPSEFEAAYGYSVFSALPALFIDFEGAEEFRYDYHLLCHRLFINNFAKVIYDWCEENGCQLTGHAIEENFLAGQMWCCGGVMPFYEYEHIPGIDYLGRGISSDIGSKQLGSACAQLGKKKALSEMFACCGWDVTPTELKRIAERQYVNGVNIMCQHLYPYSERGQRKRDYPAHYSEHLPWQDSMADFNRHFTNLGYILSRGEEYANTLVIHPVHSAYLGYKREIDWNSTVDLDRPMEALSDLLSQHQIPYHWGDECMMARMASVEGDTLRVGLCRYQYVILPHCYTLDSTTVALLDAFVKGGGKLWLYSDAPTRMDGRTADLSRFVSNVTFEDICKSSPFRTEKAVPALRMQMRETEYGRVLYAVNLGEKACNDTDILLDGWEGAYLLSTDRLMASPVQGERTATGLRIRLSFAPAESFVVVESAELPLLPSTLYEEPAWIQVSNWHLAEQPENMMILDKVRLSYDGVSYEEEKPFVEVKDRLLRERYKGDLYLRFEFDVTSLPQSLSMAAEPLNYTNAEINGVSVDLSDTPWLDPSFRTADISTLVRLGKNQITLCLPYYQREYVYYVLYGGVSESLRNCLNFDTEIEPIYLFGHFRVETDPSRFVAGEKNSYRYDGPFSLAKQTNTLDHSNVIMDGYPFYGGKLSFEADYVYTDGVPTVLCLSGRYAVAEISVNDAPVGKLLFTDRLDLGRYLNVGTNKIRVTICNAYRNLLGPHHHKDPEPFWTSPDAFSFEGSWHDGKCKDYVSAYSFIRFGFTTD
ncbi:MAG: hypothetical protein IJY12_00820 [Clostridia bacterium]|nr:hypothetical protein [Clostridia bacterium]